MCAAATVKSEIRRFLRTGESDMMAFAWPGQSFGQRAQQAHHDLVEALIAEVARRARGKRVHALPAGFDPVPFTRAKVEPMVRGLFPEREWSAVLSTLERSVVFLLPGNIADVLRAEGFLHEAWAIANLYLGSVGARLLGDGAPDIVGMNLGTKCLVSAGYFEVEDRFADFVVHEAAHVFHNCKRERLGMRSTRNREWLLPIAFRKRETFAYACEAYSRVIASRRVPRAARRLSRSTWSAAGSPTSGWTPPSTPTCFGRQHGLGAAGSESLRGARSPPADGGAARRRRPRWTGWADATSRPALVSASSR